MVRPADVSDADPVPSPESGEEALGVYVKMSSGAVQRLSSEAIEQGIQMRRIMPWDLASTNSRDFYPISEDPELRNLFPPGDFQAVAQSRCANHADAMAAATCRKCGRSYCAACVQSLFNITPRLCPACNGAISDPDPRLRQEPPWKNAKEFVRFPMEGDARVLTLLFGALIWVTSLSVYLIPIQLIALLFLVDIVLSSSKGSKRWTLSRSLSSEHLRDLGREALPVLFLTVVLAIPLLAIPFVLGPSLGVLVQFPITLVLFFYYPMAAGALLVAEDKDRALHPRAVLHAIWMVRDEYFVYIALFIAVAIAAIAVILVFTFIPYLGPLLSSIALAYGWILQAHFLGFFLYMNRERIRAAIRGAPRRGDDDRQIPKPLRFLGQYSHRSRPSPRSSRLSPESRHGAGRRKGTRRSRGARVRSHRRCPRRERGGPPASGGGGEGDAGGDDAGRAGARRRAPEFGHANRGRRS